MTEIRKDENEDASQQILDSISIDWHALIALLAPEFAIAGVAAVKELLRELGIDLPVGETGILVSFGEVDAEVKQYAEERAAELVGMHRTEEGDYVPSSQPGIAITNSTREMLRGTVRQAISEGWSAAEVQAALLADHAFSPARALNIARTETAFARNRGGLIGAKASGLVRGKTWTISDEACDLCLDNAAQGEIGLDDTFASGDPCPPGHPSCGCSLSYGLHE